MEGRLLGIARKARPRAVVETLERSSIGLETGIAGDFRGAIRPGRSNRRQVTIFAAEDWDAAIAELGVPVAWHHRRCNLFAGGIVLPRNRGARLRIGATAIIEITGECDPCRRMEEVAPGLEAALTPDWRGGRNTRIIAEGEISVGDIITYEEQA